MADAERISSPRARATAAGPAPDATSSDAGQPISRRACLQGMVAGGLGLGLGLAGCATGSDSGAAQGSHAAQTAAATDSRAPRGGDGKRRPNILLIMPDQLGADECSIYGGVKIRTPNIDQLAREGVLFETAVSPCPLCLPARGMLLTGRYPTHTGLVNNIVDPSPDFPTLATVLRAAGYRTGYIGKFHLSAIECNPPGHPEFIPPGPRRLGFDHWEANNCHLKFTPGEYFYYRDEPTPIVSPKYETDTQADQAIAFMERQRGAAEPFFLMVAPHPPHHPNMPENTPAGYLDRVPERLEFAPNIPPEFRDPDPGPDARNWHMEERCYLAMTQNVDDNVGRIMHYLERSGLAEDTIVLFTSDHGEMRGAHALIGKQQPYREGFQVPLIVRWPGVVPEGARSEHIITLMDLMPTLCALAGVAAPEGLDGRDCSEAVLGDARGARRLAADREAILLGFYQPDFEIFKEWRAVLTGQHCYARWLSGEEVLTDYRDDPWQMRNLAGDPAHGELLQRMRGHMTRLLREAHDDFLPGPEYAKWYDEKCRVVRTGLGPVRPSTA